MTDRIVLTWHSSDNAIRDAIEEHGDIISTEVLASRLVYGGSPAGTEVEAVGHQVWLEIG